MSYRTVVRFKKEVVLKRGAGSISSEEEGDDDGQEMRRCSLAGEAEQEEEQELEQEQE